MTGKATGVKNAVLGSGYAGIALLIFFLWTPAALAQWSHEDRISDYQGPQTCLECHSGQGLEVFDSVHYQWRGDSSAMVNPPGPKAGKLGSINDFCGLPDINWIGIMTTVSGNETSGGCALCHNGLGRKPAAGYDQAESSNLDCLSCHSDIYFRKVSRTADGFTLEPDTEKMTVTPTQAAQRVGKPSSKACLTCHAYAAGGHNWKRGDLSEDQLNPAADHDVHLAAKSDGGAGLDCASCHAASGHKFAGRGSDLRPLDTDTDLSCTRCHAEQPHDNSSINRHLGRIDCTVCHIPAFSKLSPTEMVRDWSQPAVYNESKDLFEPAQVMSTNVTPAYRWFNGKSVFYNYGEPPTRFEGQAIVMSAPDGMLGDGQSKLHPFKVHQSKWPQDPATGLLLPIKVGTVFQTGDVNQAILDGVSSAGWDYQGHVFADTVRYMGIFHEVRPESAALSCTDCHDGSARIDFASLGYTPFGSDPGSGLCLSCHGNESDEIGEGGLFDQVHRVHVAGRGFDCSRCHSFSASSTQIGGGGGGGGGEEEVED